MDIKYTIEILTKDIQDIEKLVGKLQNSKEASAIELDLAMSKLRNVYEILTMIKADRLNALIDPPPGKTESGAEAVPETQAVPEPEAEPEAEAVPEKQDLPEPEAEPETEPEAEAVAPSESAPEAEEVTKPAAETPPETEAEEPEIPGQTPSASGQKEGAILAEKFKAGSSINENLAETRGEAQDTKLIGQPIDHIARHIGINDRFLIIRELFDGNSEDFSKLITRLDGAQTYQNAHGMLEEHFAGSMDHEGVEILSGLVKRRYLR